jgi:hypothetical protein
MGGRQPSRLLNPALLCDKYRFSSFPYLELAKKLLFASIFLLFFPFLINGESIVIPGTVDQIS